jgi:hypothetical protein
MPPKKGASAEVPRSRWERVTGCATRVANGRGELLRYSAKASATRWRARADLISGRRCESPSLEDTSPKDVERGRPRLDGAAAQRKVHCPAVHSEKPFSPAIGTRHLPGLKVPCAASSEGPTTERRRRRHVTRYGLQWRIPSERQGCRPLAPNTLRHVSRLEGPRLC